MSKINKSRNIDKINNKYKTKKTKKKQNENQNKSHNNQNKIETAKIRASQQFTC